MNIEMLELTRSLAPVTQRVLAQNCAWLRCLVTTSPSALFRLGYSIIVITTTVFKTLGCNKSAETLDDFADLCDLVVKQRFIATRLDVQPQQRLRVG